MVELREKFSKGPSRSVFEENQWRRNSKSILVASWDQEARSTRSIFQLLVVVTSKSTDATPATMFYLPDQLDDDSEFPI